MLAAIAGRTSRIKLGTAVTVLSTDDPVRVFQRFSTLHALSNSRAEPILGRGSFTESYPLFGHDLNDYEQLFEDRLDLFAHLTRSPTVTWSGKTCSPLKHQQVFPTLGQPMTVWVGVGGSPESVVRVVRHDLQLMLAIIGGDSARCAPYIDLYHRACDLLGRPVRPGGVHSPGFVAETDEIAQEKLWPGYADMFGRIGRERGLPPVTRKEFPAEVQHCALYVGSPDTVARKIARTVRTLGIQRFDRKYSTGPMAHADLMTCIRRYGEKVIPMAQDMLAEKAA